MLKKKKTGFNLVFLKHNFVYVAFQNKLIDWNTKII